MMHKIEATIVVAMCFVGCLAAVYVTDIGMYISIQHLKKHIIYCYHSLT